jgi:prephenate dehydrogenase
MKTIGLLGFGQFGQFITPHLSSHALVLAHDPADQTGRAQTPLVEVCAQELVLFAVPAQSFEAVCQQAAPLIPASTLIADVTSVKIRPLQILAHYFPTHEILGTHPIFGPQSGRDGISGLPIVVTNLSWIPAHYEQALQFLSQTLGLRVIEKTAEEHDLEMAHVQGLSHFIGRALAQLDIQAYDTSTASYKQLVQLKNLLKDDSWELFKTIQQENPYAAEVRKNFLSTLQSLEDALN